MIRHDKPFKNILHTNKKKSSQHIYSFFYHKAKYLSINGLILNTVADLLQFGFEMALSFFNWLISLLWNEADQDNDSKKKNSTFYT